MPSRTLAKLGIVGALLTSPTLAASGDFSVLAYNVAGLLELVSSAESNREEATKIISCYINQFDHVNVQEDFNYHSFLYDTCNDHPFRSPTSGGMGFGSGLNTLSRFAYEDFERVRWSDCNGVDCLTPKGFTLARMRLAEGVFVDMYNLHTQAQVADADLSARRGNIDQLVRFIEQYSVGNAVIIAGDTNTRYTRAGDNIRELTNRGFKDPWVEQERAGSYPASGSSALTCDPKVTSPGCEIVDKVLYRSSSFLSLNADLYQIRQDDKNAAGEYLSDHPPVEVRFSYSTAPDRRFSDTFGGPHGAYFNDNARLPGSPVVRSLTIRGGSRVDSVGMSYEGGLNIAHGGSGGSAKSLSLASDEYVKWLYLCTGERSGQTRVFFVEFTTNLNRVINVGSRTSSCRSFNAVAGWQIAGFFGRAGTELDKLGVVFAPTSIVTSRTGVAEGVANEVVLGGAVAGVAVVAAVGAVLLVKRSRKDTAAGVVGQNDDPFSEFQVVSKQQEQMEAQDE